MKKRIRKKKEQKEGTCGTPFIHELIDNISTFDINDKEYGDILKKIIKEYESRKSLLREVYKDIDRIDYQDEITKIPEVENVLIENFGGIQRAAIKFLPGLNIIIGKNGSGKTTVINYLIKMYNPIFMSTGDKVMFAIDKEINKTCILIDNSLCRLENQNLIKTLKKLENCNKQVIVTLHTSMFDSIKIKIKANIIDTADFELKRRL